MQEEKERRAHLRVEVNCNAHCRVEGGEEAVTAVVRNFSGGGLLLTTDREITVGTRLQLEIAPVAGGPARPFHTRVEVIRCGVRSGAGDFILGCRIEQDSSRDETGADG